MIVIRGEFKGKPVLTIKQDENDKFPLTFGVKKAKKILDCLVEIEDFVKENEEPKS